jgi:hypothetical protein
MMRSVFALLLMTMAAAAAPSPEELARCVAIPAADARLACYDALAHRVVDRAPTAASSKPAPPAAQSAPAAAVQSAPAPAADVAGVNDAKDFGLTPAQRHVAESGPPSITAHITQLTPAKDLTLMALDNDQRWAVEDNDGRLSVGDAVRIKRAAMGSFLMITASNHTYRVRRTK